MLPNKLHKFYLVISVEGTIQMATVIQNSNPHHKKNRSTSWEMLQGTTHTPTLITKVGEIIQISLGATKIKMCRDNLSTRNSTNNPKKRNQALKIL